MAIIGNSGVGVLASGNLTIALAKSISFIKTSEDGLKAKIDAADSKSVQTILDVQNAMIDYSVGAGVVTGELKGVNDALMSVAHNIG